MLNRLSGIKIRKAIELNLSIEDIFQIDTKEEGDKAAKEIYQDDISHSSEIENLDEIFLENENILYYYSPKEEFQLTTNLKAYVYDCYIANKEEVKSSNDFKINSEKSKEIFFLNTEKIDYFEFLLNLLEAHKFLGKFNKSNFKKRFYGIGDFKMEEYALNHIVVEMSDLNMLDFYIEDSNLVSTISNILSANYEKDILEQKEYFSNEEYESLLETVKKHKKILSEANLNV